MNKTYPWSVRVDWKHPGYNEAGLEELVHALADHRGVVTVDPGPPHHSDRVSATLRIETTTLRQATTTALRAVEDATGIPAIGVEALLTVDFEEQLNRPSIPELVGYAEIAEMFGVSRQRARELADRSDFPPAVVTTKSGPLRVKRQVEAWASTWERHAGRPRKAAPPTTNQNGS